VFTYEVTRFADTFAHGAEALPIWSTGHIDPSDRYANEYPVSFILLSEALLLQNTDPLALMRFIELFTIMLLITLVYFIARIFSPTYAAFAPLGFIGAFWVDQGHFSPQGIALVLYLVFFLSVIKVVTTSEYRRSWLILAIIMLFAITFTSPTNSFFLVASLASIGAVSYMLVRRNPTTDRIIAFTVLAGILFLAWSIYNAESRTIVKAEVFGAKLSEDFGDLEKIKVTPSPSVSYELVNYVRAGVSAFVISSGIVMSLFLVRKKNGTRPRDLVILVGWFATASLILIGLYLSPVLVSRNFLYVSIVWSIMLAAFFSTSSLGKWDKSLRITLLVFIIILVISIPITRYGRDPTTYVSLSLLDAIEELVGGSHHGERVVSYFMGSAVTKYVAASKGVKVEARAYETIFDLETRKFKYVLEGSKGNINSTLDWIRDKSATSGKVIFSEPEKNSIVMKWNAPGLYSEIEGGVRENYNLIISNGATRIYSSPHGTLPH
jgi:hypothetical protein